MILTEKIGEMNVWEFVIALFLVQLITLIILEGIKSVMKK
jgi:hypothetical protein